MYAAYAIAEPNARPAPSGSMLPSPPTSTSVVPALAAPRASARRLLQRSRCSATAPSITSAGYVNSNRSTRPASSRASDIEKSHAWAL